MKKIIIEVSDEYIKRESDIIVMCERVTKEPEKAKEHLMHFTAIGMLKKECEDSDELVIKEEMCDKNVFDFIVSAALLNKVMKAKEDFEDKKTRE